MKENIVSKEQVPPHLSEISTRWSLVRDAHEGGEDTVLGAQRELLQRYCGAVYRYFLGILRNADTAEELAQEFALRFVRGDFHQANPERGRFRDFLKTALYHMVVDHYRRRLKEPGPLPPDSADLPTTQPDEAASDREFLDRWRDELLAQTWKALEKLEEQTGQVYYRALSWRAAHSAAPASELAAKLQSDVGRPFSEAGVWQTLHRAREKFADLLIDEVTCSLRDPSSARLEQELIDLGLISYCERALARRAKC